MTELLFGAQKLNGQSKPVTCILGYEPKLREILTDIDNDPTNSNLQPIGSEFELFFVFLYFRVVNKYRR